MKVRRASIAPLIGIVLAGFTIAGQSSGEPFRVMSAQEATIADIRAALMKKEVTCRQLVQAYIDRIEAYDRKGPSLNAILMVNPSALPAADALDQEFARAGVLRPLHCVPTIVKDNYDTTDMPTSAGSLSLKGSTTATDAFIVHKLREAGAVMLAKSNMAEFAWSPFETVGSLLPGYTHNPYALDRVPAGSSGGTAAAIAANFGVIGLGTDTGNSIRGPSSHTSLVGIRSTMGLTSRDGIVPLFLSRDIGGPMTRTVSDAVAVFELIAGTDPNDPVTSEAQSKRPDNYLKFLDPAGLKGVRIGVLRQLMGPDSDPEIGKTFDQALTDMKSQGAEIVGEIKVAEIDDIPVSKFFCNRFKHDINAYLAKRNPPPPVKNLEEIIASTKFHPSIEKRMLDAQAEAPPDENPKCQEAAENAKKLAAGILKAMDEGQLDALVYPSWNNPPRLIGDLNTPHGNNSPRVSPPTGFPAITVPMGFVRGGTLPAGRQMLGRPWSEPTLIKIAYAYEQTTKHRRPPSTTPPLPGGF
jgi:amidase